ncbi:aminotransferase class I/II-fold pyridoxal phosphate-dependent enzyme [Flagellimonas lutaonensis]|uniref:8-amino-7-oxononanoate synthase n=1 Tax=Flagellimonas lutaonensis TaxID=516051 RepID=A0A0D5YSF1_9FLAO|nr:pyridoxal phosphate-dependent aminotransferase family protein [Allomuricauda lutaonensis]AKA34786.1 8-amino-7-oxononanoate synthase [Allomuricauda lutaonensis]
MPNFPKKLRQRLEKRKNENALRKLSNYKDLVDFSSNDYLGLAREKKIQRQAEGMMLESACSNGATGSRLLTGHYPLLEELEAVLAHFHKAQTALVFNSGYDANLGFFSSVPQRNDIVLYDELSHASIRDGIALGNAKSYKFKHNDLKDLNEKIAMSLRAQSRSEDSEIYVVTESVFSMDGDSPDLGAMADYCAKHKLCLIVDEAHAVGVLGQGRGLVAELDLEEKVFARLVTFGKALGCHGAAILGANGLKTYLINFARSLIYTTALPPHTTASIIAAYKLLDAPEGKEKRERLYNLIQRFRSIVSEYGLQDLFLSSDSAIQVAVLGGNKRVRHCAEILMQNGFDVRPILAPTVAKGYERLRICLHDYNTRQEIRTVLELISKFGNG